MKAIGLINPDRLRLVPAEHWVRHEFCFHLHDLMADLLIQMEVQKWGHIEFEIETEEDRRLLASGIHILDFLERTGRGHLERRFVINHICSALYADMLHFLYEGLRALEKRKFSVAFTLFRKPLREGIMLVAQMCADEEDFLDRLKSDAKNLVNRRRLNEQQLKAILESAIKRSHSDSFTNADLIYEIVFNRGNALGLAPIFDRAAHLATEFSKIETENYNLNFIFKNPDDTDIYEGQTYSHLALLLLLLNFLQLDLYGRMRTSSSKYQNWIAFTSMGAYEALFSSKRPRMTRFINRHWKEFLTCPACAQPIKIKKVDAARFFIGERVDCSSCCTTQSFPVKWLFSKLDVDLFGQTTG